MPRPHKRAKVRAQEARATQTAQKNSEAKKLTFEQYARRRAAGWALVAIAVAVGASHWLAHIGLLYRATSLTDLAIGYPTAAVFGIGGAVVLSR